MLAWGQLYQILESDVNRGKHPFRQEVSFDEYITSKGPYSTYLQIAGIFPRLI